MPTSSSPVSASAQSVADAGPHSELYSSCASIWNTQAGFATSFAGRLKVRFAIVATVLSMPAWSQSQPVFVLDVPLAFGMTRTEVTSRIEQRLTGYLGLTELKDSEPFAPAGWKSYCFQNLPELHLPSYKSECEIALNFVDDRLHSVDSKVDKTFDDAAARIIATLYSDLPHGQPATLKIYANEYETSDHKERVRQIYFYIANKTITLESHQPIGLNSPTPIGIVFQPEVTLTQSEYETPRQSPKSQR
jgi:hypothetical protein